MDDWLLILLITVEMLFDAIVVSWLSGRETKKALLRTFTEPDEAAKVAFSGLFSEMLACLMTPSIEVPIKGGEKGEVKRISPAQALMGQAADSVVNRLRGLQGAVERDANAIMGLPRKGQSTQDYLFEQLAMKLMPTVEKKVAEFASKGKNTSNLGDGLEGLNG